MNAENRSTASPLTATQLEQREFLSLMMARVADAFVRPPFYVDGELR